MLQNLQNFAEFQKCQLDNLVDFEKCLKTRIYLQRSVPIQPKTSNILLKFCRSAVGVPVVGTARVDVASRGGPAASRAGRPQNSRSGYCCVLAKEANDSKKLAN